jgi:hypothetical protein
MRSVVAEIQIGRLVKDFEIGARIFGQVRALQPETYLSERKHVELTSIVVKLMQKLEKAKYHAVRCGEIRSPSPDVAPQPGARHVDHTSGVEAEAEAFLIQAKAALDLLAKVLRPTAGISLASFGDKGDRVINALTRNVSADRRSKANELIRLIEEDKAWLTEMISLRDTVAHFDGLESSGVSAELVGDKLIVGQPTDKSGRPIAAVVGWLYGNLLTFCEDFVALAVAIAMPPALTVRVVSDSNRTDLLQSKFAIAFSVPPA